MIVRIFAAFAVLTILTGCAAGPKAGVAQNQFYGPASCGCVIVPNVGDRVFFAFAGYNLSHDSVATLEKQAEWFAKQPTANVLVAGNADERGTETYNLALGQRRADAARDELLALGVAPTRVNTISYGKDCPVAAGHDESSWQQNRNAITSVTGFNPQSCR